MIWNFNLNLKEIKFSSLHTQLFEFIMLKSYLLFITCNFRHQTFGIDHFFCFSSKQKYFIAIVAHIQFIFFFLPENINSVRIALSLRNINSIVKLFLTTQILWLGYFARIPSPNHIKSTEVAHIYARPHNYTRSVLQ